MGGVLEEPEVLVVEEWDQALVLTITEVVEEEVEVTMALMVVLRVKWFTVITLNSSSNNNNNRIIRISSNSNAIINFRVSYPFNEFEYKK